MERRKQLGQHSAEYAVLLAVIAGAAVAVGVEVGRGFKGKVAEGVRALGGIQGNFNVNGAQVNIGNKFKQYESYTTETLYSPFSQGLTREHYNNGVLKMERRDVQARKVGGFQIQRTSRNMTELDEEWNTP